MRLMLFMRQARLEQCMFILLNDFHVTIKDVPLSSPVLQDAFGLKL